MSPWQPCACTVDRRHAQQQAAPCPSAHCRTRPFPALDTASLGRSHGTFRAGCGPTKQRPFLEPMVSGGGDHSQRVPQEYRTALWGCLVESSGMTWRTTVGRWGVKRRGFEEASLVSPEEAHVDVPQPRTGENPACEDALPRGVGAMRA